VASGRHGHRSTIREHEVDLRQALDRQQPAAAKPAANSASHKNETHRTLRQIFRTVVSHRRSTMTERSPNVRPARFLERTHNSRRHRAESRWDEIPAQSRAYRGSHRAAHLHHADEGGTAARDRSSRVGRHHADHQDQSNR
jgi:hypothetical protein